MSGGRWLINKRRRNVPEIRISPNLLAERKEATHTVLYGVLSMQFDVFQKKNGNYTYRIY
jgi:hypothetical protein